MTRSKKTRFRRCVFVLASALTTTMYVSLGGACEWITTRFDPCGTLLGNCSPGSFDLAFASVPDFDLDPTCTIPGACDAPGAFVSPFDQFGPGFDGP